MNPFKEHTPRSSARTNRRCSQSQWRRLLHRLSKSESGVVAVEMALAMPLFLVLIAGIIETGHYLLLNLKLQHTAVAIADIATRDDSISEAVITDIFAAAPQIMEPVGHVSQASIIISAVSQTEDINASVFWQRQSGGLTDVTSNVGNEGEAPTLPSELVLRDNETILVTEIIYRYEPLIFSVFEPSFINRTAYFRPRIGALQEIS